MKLHIHLLIAVALAQTVLCAQSSQAGSSVSSPAAIDEASLQSLLAATAPPLLFKTDDTIAVQVYGIKDYLLQQQVAPDGTVSFPFIGKTLVAGLTVEQLEGVIAGALQSGGIVQVPQVTVYATSRPSAVVTVTGDVAKPGTFPALGRHTLMDFISEAGGLSESVSGSTATYSPASRIVTLIRPSLERPIQIPIGTEAHQSANGNIPLFQGDRVEVEKMGLVYVVGAFKNQGAYPLKNSSPTTILELAALAGGVGFEAKLRDARVIRTVDGKRVVLNIDMAKILKAKAADVALQSDDVLILPTDEMKAAIKGGGSGLLVSLVSTYLYTH